MEADERPTTLDSMALYELGDELLVVGQFSAGRCWVAAISLQPAPEGGVATLRMTRDGREYSVAEAALLVSPARARVRRCFGLLGAIHFVDGGHYCAVVTERE